MSIATVTDRILQIESQISQLQGPAAPAGNAATAAAFATELARAGVTTGSTGTTGTTATTGIDGTAATTGTAAGGSATQQAIVEEAKEFLGLPYVWGGTSKEKGVDCSGLVQTVYEKFGYELPRVSADQARAGRKVDSLAEAQPGDLIAWDNSSRNNGADHIAIYIGNGKMIEAPRTGLDVRIIDVPTTPDYIRRILPDQPAGRAGTAPAAGSGGSVPATGPTGAAGSAALASLASSRTAFDLSVGRSLAGVGAR